NFLNPSEACADETIRAIGASGLRAVFARTVMDAGEIVPDCTREKPEQAFRRIERILAAHGKQKNLSFMTGPNTPPINASPDLLREIRRFADERALGIPAQNSIFAHSVHVSKDEVGILKQTGTSVSHNPVSNMMLGDGVAPVVEMLRQGVNIALGTDGAASNHSQDLFDTMKAASLLQKV